MRGVFHLIFGLFLVGIYAPLYILPRRRRDRLSRVIIRLLASIPFYYYGRNEEVGGADLAGANDLQNYLDRLDSGKHRWHCRHTLRLMAASSVTSRVVDRVSWGDRLSCLASYREKLAKYANQPHVDAWFLAQFVFLLLHARPVIDYRADGRLVGLRFIVLIGDVACALDWVFLEQRVPPDVSAVTLKKFSIVKGVEVGISQGARFFYCGPTNMNMKRSLGLNAYQMGELCCPTATWLPFFKDVRFSPCVGAPGGRPDQPNSGAAKAAPSSPG
jgi:hypothetical protein